VTVVSTLFFGLCGALALGGSACNSTGNGSHDQPMDMTPFPDGFSDAGLPLGPATKCAPIGAPQQLSNLPGTHGSPRLAYTGLGYVVGWNTTVSTGSGDRHRIDVALMDKLGSKMGPNLPMSDQPVADQWGPSLTPLVGGTVVAWTRQEAVVTATDIVIDTIDHFGQKLDPQGKPCDPALLDCGIFQVTTSTLASMPYLARPQVDQHTANPIENQVGLAYIDTRNYPCAMGPCILRNDVYWKKIQSNGAELIPDKRITMAGANARYSFPRLAFDGVHQGLVWRDETSGTSTDFYFATIDTLGMIASAAVKIGTVSGANVSLGTPDLIWTGSEYALAASTGSDVTSSVVFQRNASNGQSTLAPKGVTFGGVACTPAIAWDGEYYAVVWQTGCGQPGANLAFELIDSSGVRVQADGTSCGSSLDPTCGVQLLTQNDKDVASYPEIVWAGGHTFSVVWQQGPAVADGGVTASDVFFSRIDCNSP
jgi:hypothetical protein